MSALYINRIRCYNGNKTLRLILENTLRQLEFENIPLYDILIDNFATAFYLNCVIIHTALKIAIAYPQVVSYALTWISKL